MLLLSFNFFFFFFATTFGSMWKNYLLTVEGFQSTNPKQIYFPKLYFICGSYLNYGVESVDDLINFFNL